MIISPGKLARWSGNVGVVLLGATGYLGALEYHYSKHPGARQDGLIPLEWRSHDYIAHHYRTELERFSFSLVPCSESYLKAGGVDAASYSRYAKYRIASSGETVYFQDDNDRQADAHSRSLQEVQEQNAARMADMGFAEAAEVEREMRAHLNRLHEYNELKDVGQALLGRLAVLRGLTTKALYPDFGIELED